MGYGVQLEQLGDGSWQLTSFVDLRRPLDELFAFFADATNLEVLTPDSLRFQIVTPSPIEMHRGTRIDYRLRVRGLPIRWRTHITEWDPPHRFADEQERGPYRHWRHEHEFEALDADTTRVLDRVTYRAPFPLVTARFVNRDVRAIFAFRAEQLRQEFGSP